MGASEVEAIGAALGSRVTATRALAGGFSHQTCLLTLDGGQVVARLGGQQPAIESAVMTAAARHVPVPHVLAVLPAAATGGRPAMVIEFVPGTPLSQVLAGQAPAGGGNGTAGWDALGAEVGKVVARISATVFDRPGFFADEQLTVTDEPRWSQQLPQLAADCMAAVPDGRLDAPTRRAWADLCEACAPALAAVDDQAMLVHADINPKNILVTRTRAGWRVDAVLDWEFAFSGCPYADAANMARFRSSYPPGFSEGFSAAFACHQPSGAEPPVNWEYLGHVFDMFALSDLVTRPPGHPVADQAAAQIRRWVTDGLPAAR